MTIFLQTGELNPSAILVSDLVRLRIVEHTNVRASRDLQPYAVEVTTTHGLVDYILIPELVVGAYTEEDNQVNLDRLFEHIFSTFQSAWDGYFNRSYISYAMFWNQFCNSHLSSDGARQL